MKLANFRHEGRAFCGIVTDAGIVDLGRRLGINSVDEVLRAESLARFTAKDLETDFGLGDVAWLLPVLRPEKIICVGINYPLRADEYAGKAEQGAYPNLFARFPGSFSPHGMPLRIPMASSQLDYEGEIGLIIGSPGRGITEDAALSHVAGCTLANEGTVRDWVRHGTLNVTQGKNFDNSGAMGPWMVTSDEVDLRHPIRLRTSVNGDLRQDDTTDRLTWSFASLISYISTFTTLMPGDVILTGSPVGAGGHRTPPVYLVEGDEVTVEADRLGTLVNPVVADKNRPHIGGNARTK